MLYSIKRRHLLRRTATALGMLGVSPALAALTATPRQTRGPFYPRELPLDADADLTRVAGRSGIAGGQILDLSGLVADARGTPMTQALVEIWQCDVNGRYHHPAERPGGRDDNFQGYGRYTTGSDGRYRFRTIRPVAYPGRTPHIHFAVSGPGLQPLVTQMYVAGEPGNADDVVYRRISDPQARASITIALQPIGGAAKFQAQFDLVVRRGSSY